MDERRLQKLAVDDGRTGLEWLSGDRCNDLSSNRFDSEGFIVKETIEQYMQRINGYMEGKQPLAVQTATSKKLERLIQGVPTAKLRKRPAPDKWSVSEILAHLADAEMVGGFRMRLILGAPGTPIAAFDQDSWVTSGHYEKRDPRKSLELFRTLRAANLALLKSLTPEQWKHYGMHAERGQETIERIVRMFAGHDINHLQQIRHILGK
jgi:DinB family protein